MRAPFSTQRAPRRERCVIKTDKRDETDRGAGCFETPFEEKNYVSYEIR